MMLLYLLKTALLMGLLLAVYQLVLSRERLHAFSRYYLLGSLLLSLVAPLISIDIGQAAVSAIGYTPIVQLAKATQEPALVLIQSTPIAPNSVSIETYLLGVYLVVVGLLLLRFALNIRCIRRMAKRSCQKPIGGAMLVLLDGHVTPYSWWQYIFLQKDEYEQGAVAPEIITHELAHIRQHHTIDILIVELLQLLLWFNPLVYLFKKAIRQNHEYLADQAVTTHHANVNQYQHLLLDTIFRKNTPSLVSNINFSLTKKRLVMMTKKTSQVKAAIIRTGSLVLLCFVAFIFCTKVVEPVAAQVSKANSTNLQAATLGISADTLELVKKLYYASTNVRYRKGDGSWHKPAYNELNPVERRLIGSSLMPRKKNPPTQADLNEWVNTAKYGLWIDGKHVTNNATLTKYKPADFSGFFVSKLCKNAQHGVNAGKLYQVDVQTNAAFESANQKRQQQLEQLLQQVRASK